MAGPWQAVSPCPSSALIASPIHPHSHWAAVAPLAVFSMAPRLGGRVGGTRPHSPSAYGVEDGAATQTKSSSRPRQVKQLRVGKREAAPV